MRVTDQGIWIVLLDDSGEASETTQVANNLQAVVRVIKHWRRTHGLDPSNAVFCVEEAHPFPGPMLELMLDRGWEIMVVVDSGTPLSDERSTPVTVAESVGLAMRSAVAIEPLSLARLHVEKVDRLRQRR